jgi:hypothetical protein
MCAILETEYCNDLSTSGNIDMDTRAAIKVGRY